MGCPASSSGAIVPSAQQTGPGTARPGAGSAEPGGGRRRAYFSSTIFFLSLNFGDVSW